MIKTRWKLRAFMAQHKIKNIELAEAMKKHSTTIARLKNSDKIPPVGGDVLDDLCYALTQILAIQGFDRNINLTDLIEFYED